MLEEKTTPWWDLPEADKAVLSGLVDTYGMGRILAMLSRLQLADEKKHRRRNDRLVFAKASERRAGGIATAE